MFSEKTIQNFVCPTGGDPYIYFNYIYGSPLVGHTKFKKSKILCAPPGETHIYTLTIYMGPPRWGTQNFNFFSKVLAILGHSRNFKFFAFFHHQGSPAQILKYLFSTLKSISWHSKTFSFFSIIKTMFSNT